MRFEESWRQHAIARHTVLVSSATNLGMRVRAAKRLRQREEEMRRLKHLAASNV